MNDRIVLITGATGQQGGATVSALLESQQSWHVRAMVRNPQSKAALSLADRGVDLVKGNLDDLESLRRALVGAYGVFSVQSPMEGGPEGEERQGKALADAAKNAGVSHFVYSSVAGAERHSGVPHFDSKRRVEQHIERLELRATILRPSLFMDNFATFKFRTIMLMMLKTFVDDHQKIQMIAVRDIGRFAAKAFNAPAEYIGRSIELAGDTVSRPELVRALRATGKRPAISIRVPNRQQSMLPEEYCLMMRWIAGKGFEADLRMLRKEMPDLMGLHSWAETAV